MTKVPRGAVNCFACLIVEGRLVLHKVVDLGLD